MLEVLLCEGIVEGTRDGEHWEYMCTALEALFMGDQRRIAISEPYLYIRMSPTNKAQYRLDEGTIDARSIPNP